MIDYHCHILPGLDDGSRTMAESLEMATALHDAGYSCVHCTPHCISGLYDIPVDEVRQAVDELQEQLHAARIPLWLKVGMEYYLDDSFVARLDNPLTIGDTRMLLFELPARGNLDALKEAIFQIRKRGLIPLLAHPERYPTLMPRSEHGNYLRRLMGGAQQTTQSEVNILPPIVTEIIDMGCRLQGDLGSFNGIYGEQAQHAAYQYWRSGCYACYGSDGHRVDQLQKALANCTSIYESGYELRYDKPMQ